MAYLAILPWILFFPIYSYFIYYGIKENNSKDLLKWMNNNFFKMFRFDILLLIIIFINFIRYNNYAVNLMLFFMTNLYLFINILYDYTPPKKIKVNYKVLIVYLILILIPIMYYLVFKKFVITSLIMFAYTFLAYFIVIDIKILNYHITKRLKLR